MGEPTLLRLKKAISSGDKQAALSLADKYAKESLAMHDLYRDWLTASLSKVAEKHGHDSLDEVMEAGVKATWLPTVKVLSEKNLKHAIKMYVGGLRGHHQPLDITEDEEKITIKLSPCGSGGRLVQQGMYDHDEFSYVDSKSSLTWNREQLPVYCTHDPVMERVDIDAHGFPFVVIQPAEKIGKQPCFMHIYKDPEKIPAAYFNRINRTKPSQ